MKRYYFYGTEGYVMFAEDREEQPDNATEIEPIGMVKAKWDGEKWVESATSTQILAIKIENKIAENAQRRADGIVAYERVASEMDTYVELGIVTQLQFEYISDVMKPVRDEIIVGRWKEALDILISLQPRLDTKTYNKFYKIITDYLGI